MNNSTPNATNQRGVTGKRPSRTFAIPADFSSIAPTLTIGQAVAHYGVSKQTLYRWQEATGARFQKPRREPVPDGFEANFRTMNKLALSVLYKVGIKIVQRWSDNMPADAKAQHKDAVTEYRRAHTAAMTAANRANTPPKPKKEKGAKKRAAPGSGISWGKAKAMPVPDAKVDVVSLAMRYLMRDHVPVCRSETIAGKAAQGFFRVGQRTLTEPEMLAFAARKGFSAPVGFAG